MPGNAPRYFDRPSAVAVAPDGTIFVADGYGGDSNARIVKLGPNGKVIKTWDEKGSGPGEFNEPYGIALDSADRVFVADWANSLIQIFDPDGNFIAEWKQFGRPSAVFIDKNDVIYVADSQTEDKEGCTSDPDAAAASGSATPRTGPSNTSSRVPTRRTTSRAKVSRQMPQAISLAPRMSAKGCAETPRSRRI
jgi:DNA-binding beta-propeller fold protein YncE